MASFGNRELSDNATAHRGNIASLASTYYSALDGGNTKYFIRRV